MDQLIGIDELAEFLGIPKATLYDWRKRGRGPAAYRLGKHLRWRLSEVEAWLEERRDEWKEAWNVVRRLFKRCICNAGVWRPEQ